MGALWSSMGTGSLVRRLSATLVQSLPAGRSGQSVPFHAEVDEWLPLSRKATNNFGTEFIVKVFRHTRMLRPRCERSHVTNSGGERLAAHSPGPDDRQLNAIRPVAKHFQVHQRLVIVVPATKPIRSLPDGDKFALLESSHGAPDVEQKTLPRCVVFLATNKRVDSVPKVLPHAEVLGHRVRGTVTMERNARKTGSTKHPCDLA